MIMCKSVKRQSLINRVGFSLAVYPKPMVNVTSKLYLDVWTDVVTSASPGFSPRLAQANQHWLLGVLKETEYRKFKTIPSSIDEYVQMRRRTAGLLHCVVRIEFYQLDETFGPKINEQDLITTLAYH